MSADLIAFLNARLDEDEAAAKAATGAEWAALDGGVMSIDDDSQWPVAQTDSQRDRDDRVHIARHDPARVLREVEAKRARLALYEQAQAKLDHILAHPGEMSAGDEGLWLGKVAAARMACRHDAAVYRDHPGYREDWAPAAVIMR